MLTVVAANGCKRSSRRRGVSRAGLGGAPSGAMVVRQPAARVRRRPARVRAVPRDHPVAVLTAPRRPPHRVLRMPADTPANAPMVIAVLQPLPLAPHRDAHRTPPRAPRRRRRVPVFARAVTDIAVCGCSVPRMGTLRPGCANRYESPMNARTICTDFSALG